MGVFERKIIDDDEVYPYKQYSWDGDVLEYIGYNENYNAADSDLTWKVKKFTWSGNDIVSKQTRINISWTDRATGW